MGWTTGWHSRKELIVHLTAPSFALSCKELKHCFVGNNMWAVYEHEDGQRFIALFLIRGWRVKEYDGLTWDWGYKDMDETSDPHHTGCPLGYLELATPAPVNKYSREWRERVRADHARRAGIKLGSKLTLTNSFTYQVVKLRPLEAVDRLGNRYRIPRKMITSVTPPC